jgi:protein phosphatase
VARAVDDRSARVISIPHDALVLLIGVAGSGKTTFAARHFDAGDVISSDSLRALVAGSATDQSATDDAFDMLHRIVSMRLARGRLTLVDATNVEPFAREQLHGLAWRARRPVVGIVLDPGLAVALERNVGRLDGARPPAAVRRQQRWLERSLAELEHEGFVTLERLTDADPVVHVERAPAAGRARRNPEGTPRPPR